MTNDWQPIETAPKSSTKPTMFGNDVTGVYLELYCPESVGPRSDPLMGISIGWWEPHMDGQRGRWQGEGDFPLKPTHWRHLRPAPENAERRGEE